MRRRRAKRWLAMLMSLAMVLSLLPAAAMAAAVEETAPEEGIVDDVGGGVIPDDVPDDGAAGSGESEDGEPNDGEPEDGAPNGGEGEDGEPAPDGEAGDGEGETEETPDGSGSDEGEKDGNEDALPEDGDEAPDDGAAPDGDEVPDEDGVSEEELARIEEQWAEWALRASVLPDGALVDRWAQIEASKGSSPVDPYVDDGEIVLSAVTGNGNNLNGDNPAIFVDTTMNKALSALDGSAEKTLSFTLTPSSSGSWMGFALMLNYDGTTGSNVKAYHIGYPSGETTGWFTQNYGAATSSWPGFTGPVMEANRPVDFEISWSDTGVSSFRIGGENISLPADCSLTTVPVPSGDNSAGFMGVAFKVSGKSGDMTTLRISNLHYTGQTEVEAYTLSGTVTDEDNSPVADASVTVSSDKHNDEAITNGQGVYSLELPNGSYTLTVSKEGYDDETATVEVSGSDISNKDITLSTTKTVEIPSNGVFDNWTQLEASKKGNAVAPAVVDGKLVLQATPQNVNNLNANAPAVFTNATLNAALASTTGEKFLSFTVIPETVKENQVPDWVGFGVAIDYNDQVGTGAEGYYIGYPAGPTTGWFVERLGGDGGYPGFTAPDVVPGEPLKVEIRWTADKVTLKLNDVSYDLPDNGSQKGVPVTNKIGIKLGSNTYNGTELQGSRTTKLTLSDIHYSGQETVTGHYVRGVVRDDSGRALAGATVTASDGTTATTDNSGAYSMVLAESSEAYTLTASMDGYGDKSVDVTVDENSTEDELENVSFNLELLPVLTGKVTEKGTAKAVKGASVALYEAGAEEDAEPFKTAVSGEDGTYRIIGVPSGDYTLKVSCEGYTETTVETVTVESEDAVQNVELEVYTVPFHTLSTASMDVMVDQTFPRVIKYVMKGELAGEELWGQSAILDTIKINGTDVKPTVTSQVVGSEKAVYTMVIDSGNNNGTGVTATITAELRVGLDGLNDPGSDAADRTLGFYITDVTYPNNDKLEHPVETIEIPNHSLVSVRSTEPGATVTGGKQAANTTESGDVSYPAAGNENFAGYTEDFFAAFVYNDSLSASLASNSAYAARGTAGDQCYPVRAQFDAKDGGSSVAIGLGSTLWYYHYDITKSEGDGLQRLTEDQLPSAKRIMEPLETPFAKVVITGDMNGNREVDWQDAAIAYRETVMHIPAGGEGVADSVNLRISMNFGSMATNPFLIALDNVKRVAAHTDGLGQFVLLKGYAGEGHDSNHPQYDNIGVRMGGAEDMVTLMREGGELGAVFGIHTNASEFYAEAIEEENQVLRYAAGGMKYGWNWLDQGISINAVYDYAMGLRKTRWDKLYDIVQGYPFVVYVDVWGNNTSGTEDAFQTRALSEEIISHDGWRIAHEWAWANPYESTFQHWTTDFTYGDYSQKGKLSGNVLRFILNQYKDSFPPDFASYGGSANAPLLGGPAMQGFEGWQGDGEYSLSIYNTYNQMIYTKFLQHYPVVEWINADAPVVIPYNGGGAGGSRSNSTTSRWTPETQIRLSDGADEIVVTRGTSGRVVTDFGMDTVDKFLDGETEYRSRVVTLNGKVIAEGAPASAGEDNTFPKEKATLRYLIPWYWDNEGERVAPADEKLYHWNATSEATEWELPDGWENLSSVMIYELSDQGRGAGRRVSVSNGWITLSGIKPNTGYVVTKDAGSAPAPQINYGTDLYLEDPSFNLDTAKGPWTVSGSGSAVRTTNTEGISVLKMIGAVSVSQKLSGLQAGKVYAMYAAVDNRSNAKAVMTITDSSGKVVATNYTERSIARNYISSYYLHNGHGMEAGTSFFQNMFLYFTPQAGETYTLTLSRTAGSGSVYFDDIRTVEYRGSESPVVYNPETGAATELHQDFENVPQGIWPFVVGPVENVADNRTHLSELNGEFTQAGWDVKKMDDVIDGNWSIKSNGLHGRNNLVYQTIPQNFRFEPDKVYTVSFDYELGSAGSYVAVVGDGAYAGLGSLTVHNLEQTLDKNNVPGSSGVAGNDTAKAKVGHIEFTVVGSKSGQTWVGIYSKENANSQGTSGSEAAFGGYLDFVLDNLSIELAAPEKTELALLLQEADAMVEEVYIEDSAGDWNAFVTARTSGHAVFDKEDASTAEVTAAVDGLKAAMAKLTKAVISISGTVTNTLDAAVEGAVLTLEDSRYFPTGLTVTTGADGTFQFVSKSGVELLPGTYHIKVEATGYYVTTTGDIVVTKADGVKTQDIQLEAEAPGAYVNDFNSGDISMMGPVVDGPANELPTTEWVEYNGSGALKVIWNGLGGQAARPINNVVDKTISFANGTFSFDVTALTTGARFNVTMRTTSGSNRLTVGQEDSPNKWFCEYWGADGSGNWTGAQDNSGKPYVEPGATRNVRVTLDGYDVTVYIDGMAVYTNNLQNIGAITTPGWCGINMSGNQGSEFILDNIRIIRADPADGVQNVTGTITARSGVAVSGAAVELYKDGARVAGTATNALGQYQVSRVEPGAYTLKVSAPFFGSQEKSITVTGGSDLTGQDFTLIPDISSLTALIEQVEALKEEDYTEESWAVLAEALAEAKKIDGASSVAALNTAYRNLSNARDALEAKEADAVDYSALRELYNEMALVENEGYTASAWENFQAALGIALEVLSSETTQKQVDLARDGLQSAFDSLELEYVAPDLSALRAAYAAAEGVTNENYTEESWTAFETARALAKRILDSDGLGYTQEAVDEAAGDLIAAQEALVKNSGGDNPGGDSDNPGGDSDNPGGDGDNPGGDGDNPGGDGDNPGGDSDNSGSNGGSTGGSSGGGSSSKPDAPSTSTTENPDGSITTVVTDTKTGTVTTTTEWPDGRREVIVVQADGTVTQTKTDAEGGQAEKVTDPEKNVTITVTDPAGETLVRADIPAQLPTPEQRFADVPGGHWADDAIHQMAGLGLVNGVGGNRFNHQGDMKRGDLAVILARLSNGAGDYPLTFTDVPAGKYYAGSIAWAAKTGVVTGRSDELFMPEDTITRAELAVMLYRYAQLLKLDTATSGGELSAFADGGSVADWAAEGMSWCVKNGILKGKNGGILDPRTNVTRAEVSVMLQRFINLMK